MFGIKKRGREQSTKLHRLIASSLEPLARRFAQRLRYPARRRLLNIWGARNRHKVVALYCGFVVVILAFNIAGFVNASPDSAVNEDPLRLADMTDGNPFDGMAVVNGNRESIRSSVTELAKAKLVLANRLDSLCGLEVKSREDSLEIVRIYNIFNNK